MLSPLFGERFVTEWLDAMTRAELAKIQSHAPRRRSRRTGGEWTPPRTAVATFAPHRVRSEHSEPVRAAAIVLVSIAMHLRPGKTRCNSPALYIGDPSGKRFVPQSLSGHARRSARDIERFFAVWRTAGIGPDIWQPPSTHVGVAKSGKGRAYNIFEWGELPRELALQVEHWVDALEREERQAVRAAAKAPVTAAPRGGRSKDGDALAAALAARVGAGPPLPSA